VARPSEERNQPWDKENYWSIYIRFKPELATVGNPDRGCASWLVDEAPFEELEPGRRFDLYEGRTLSVTIEILEGTCEPTDLSAS
jgi:hypothetical protein